MEKRINLTKLEPLAYKAMVGLETYLAQVNLSKSLKELIKIRASQINNCAFCINMHTADALKNGETAQRIFLISAWREAPHFFTDEEQAALAITEEVTLIHRHGVSDETYAKAASVFTDHQVAQIIIAIVTINAWNRIAVSTHQQIENS